MNSKPFEIEFVVEGFDNTIMLTYCKICKKYNIVPYSFSFDDITEKQASYKDCYEHKIESYWINKDELQQVYQLVIDQQPKSQRQAFFLMKELIPDIPIFFIMEAFKELPITYVESKIIG